MLTFDPYKNNYKETMCPGQFLVEAWNSYKKILLDKSDATSEGIEIASTVVTSMIVTMTWNYCRCDAFCLPYHTKELGLPSHLKEHYLAKK